MLEMMGESLTRGGEKKGCGIDPGGFCMPRYPDLKLDQQLHKIAMPFFLEIEMYGVKRQEGLRDDTYGDKH